MPCNHRQQYLQLQGHIGAQNADIETASNDIAEQLRSLPTSARAEVTKALTEQDIAKAAEMSVVKRLAFLTGLGEAHPTLTAEDMESYFNMDQEQRDDFDERRTHHEPCIDLQSKDCKLASRVELMQVTLIRYADLLRMADAPLKDFIDEFAGVLTTMALQPEFEPEETGW